MLNATGLLVHLVWYMIWCTQVHHKHTHTEWNQSSTHFSLHQVLWSTVGQTVHGWRWRWKKMKTCRTVMQIPNKWHLLNLLNDMPYVWVWHLLCHSHFGFISTPHFPVLIFLQFWHEVEVTESLMKDQLSRLHQSFTFTNRNGSKDEVKVSDYNSWRHHVVCMHAALPNLDQVKYYQFPLGA